MVALFLKLFSKGDQLKVKLANLKCSKLGDGHWFLIFGGCLVIGGKRLLVYVYTENSWLNLQMCERLTKLYPTLNPENLLLKSQVTRPAIHGSLTRPSSNKFAFRRCWTWQNFVPRYQPVIHRTNPGEMWMYHAKKRCFRVIPTNWFSTWHIFRHPVYSFNSFWRTFWRIYSVIPLAFYLAACLAFYHMYTYIHTYINTYIHTYMYVCMYVCMYSIWRSRLRCGSAHWDLELAVEGPAVPTELLRSRLRPGSAHWDLELAVWGGRGGGSGGRGDEGGGGRHAALIKSRDPHLAGGEKV